MAVPAVVVAVPAVVVGYDASPGAQIALREHADQPRLDAAQAAAPGGPVPCW
jgi:hypothetical protein